MIKAERNLDMLIDRKKYTRIEEKMESLVARERKGGGEEDCNSRFIFRMHDIAAESIETRDVLGSKQSKWARRRAIGNAKLRR